MDIPVSLLRDVPIGNQEKVETLPIDDSGFTIEEVARALEVDPNKPVVLQAKAAGRVLVST